MSSEIVAYRGERRRKARVSLACKVRLIRAGSLHAVETTTKNISSTGMYCIVHESFTVGESVWCMLLIPAFDPAAPGRMLACDCTTKVVRVELAGPSEFGIALSIESYCVLTAELHEEREHGSHHYQSGGM